MGTSNESNTINYSELNKPIPKREEIHEKFWFINAGLLPISRYHKGVIQATITELNPHELHFVLFLGIKYLVHYLELFTFDMTPILVEVINNQINYLKLLIGSQSNGDSLINFNLMLKLGIIFNKLTENKPSEFVKRQLYIDQLEKFCNLFGARLSIWLKSSTLQAYLYNYGFDPYTTICFYNSFLIPNESKYVDPILVLRQRFIEKIELKCHCKIILVSENSKCGVVPSYVTLEVLFDIYQGNYVGFLDMFSSVTKRLHPSIYIFKSLRTVILEGSCFYNIMSDLPVHKLKYLEKHVKQGLPIEPFLNENSISKHLFSVLGVLRDNDKDMMLHVDKAILKELDIVENNEPVEIINIDSPEFYDNYATEDELLHVFNYTDIVEYSFKVLKYFELKYANQISQYNQDLYTYNKTETAVVTNESTSKVLDHQNSPDKLQPISSNKSTSKDLDQNTPDKLQPIFSNKSTSKDLDHQNTTNKLQPISSNKSNVTGIKEVSKTSTTTEEFQITKQKSLVSNNDETQTKIKQYLDFGNKIKNQTWISKQATQMLISNQNTMMNLRLKRFVRPKFNLTIRKSIDEYLVRCGGKYLLDLFCKFNFYQYKEWIEFIRMCLTFNYDDTDTYDENIMESLVPKQKVQISNNSIHKVNNFHSLFRLINNEEPYTKSQFQKIWSGVGVDLKLLPKINCKFVKYPAKIGAIKSKKILQKSSSNMSRFSMLLAIISYDLRLMIQTKHEYLIFILSYHFNKFKKLFNKMNQQIKPSLIQLNIIEKIETVIRSFQKHHLYFDYAKILANEILVYHYIVFKQRIGLLNLPNCGLKIVYHSILPTSSIESIEPFLKLPNDQRVSKIEQLCHCKIARRSQKHYITKDPELIIDIYYNYDKGDHFCCIDQLKVLFSSPISSFTNNRSLVIFPHGEIWTFSNVECLKPIFKKYKTKTKLHSSTSFNDFSLNTTSKSFLSTPS